ncbi:MAG TPA: hypothetical protein VIU61_07155 [Kofleriaceae bacterium]
MGGGDQEAEKLRKEEQKAAKKKKRKLRDNEAASTDIADVTKLSDEEAEQLEQKSRKERAKGMPKDVTGRIINISVVPHPNGSGAELSKIMIGARVKGMQGAEGYIKRGSGMLAKFRIGLHDDRTAFAFVDLTPDQLHPHVSDIVINPTAMPKSSERREDIATRVISIDIVKDRTRIKLGVGSSHGARDGMKGHLVHNGKPYISFVVTKVNSLHSEAFVDTTIDDVRNHNSVMLNPS